jgi:hypothetical protein
VADKIIPLSRSLYLCDFHVGYQDGKVDLYGVFTGIRPALYPHARPRMTVFTQLTGGLGDVPVYLDVRREGEDVGIHTTPTITVRFPTRTVVVQLAVTIEGCRFPEAGVYVIDLFCHNTWVCDTTVTLH